MSNTFYVLKDKKYGSYCALSGPAYVASVKDATRFDSAYGAKEACRYGTAIRANSSLLTGGLEIVKVTEKSEKSAVILGETEFAIGTVKYVVQDGSYFLNVKKDGWVSETDDATHFDTQNEAIYAISERSRTLDHSYRNCSVLRVLIVVGTPTLTEEVIDAAGV